MGDLDCDCDFGDSDCDCDCCGDDFCCCCCDCDCDFGACLHDFWTNVCCILCINVNDSSNRRHNPYNHNHDNCFCCCCCCSDDDNYRRRQPLPPQPKQESNPNSITKQRQENIIGTRKESDHQQWERNRRKEYELEHAPNCPRRGSNMPNDKCPYKCRLVVSPSFDLDPPMAQRFQALNREELSRGHGYGYGFSRNQRHHW